jgi:hypothetical protein
VNSLGRVFWNTTLFVVVEFSKDLVGGRILLSYGPFEPYDALVRRKTRRVVSVK